MSDRSVSIKKDGDRWVASCVELGLSHEADNKLDAINAVREEIASKDKPKQRPRKKPRGAAAGTGPSRDAALRNVGRANSCRDSCDEPSLALVGGDRE